MQTRPRLSSAEVRQRMLSAGVRHVRENGLSMGFEHLSMDDLIRDANVPRSSTYRLWDTRDSYVNDLLVEVALTTAHVKRDSDTVELGLGVIREHLDMAHSPHGRLRLMREVIRVTLEQNYYTLIDSSIWHTLVSVSGTLLGNLDRSTARRVDHALQDGGGAFVREIADLYRHFNRLLGFQMKAQHRDNYELFTVMTCAMVEGLGLRHLSNPSVADSFFVGPPTLGPYPAEWSPASLGLLALFNFFFEQDPHFEAADLNFVLGLGNETLDS